jgi:hypothetical protein
MGAASKPARPSVLATGGVVVERDRAAGVIAARDFRQRDTRNEVHPSAQLCPTVCPTSPEFPVVEPNQAGIIIRASGVRVSSNIFRGPASTQVPDSWHGALQAMLHSLLGAIPARQPAHDPAEHEPGLGREREIGRHADDDAERQTQHRSERDRGSDAHTRKFMRGV